MTRHVFALALAGALLAPSAASAKEISKVAVCGQAKQCTTYDKDDANLMLFIEQRAETDPPAKPGAFYRVTASVDHEGVRDSWTTTYVPSAGLVRLDDGARFIWMTLNPEAKAALDKAVKGLTAFPASRLGGLDAKRPEAIVSEVFNPAAEAAARAPIASPDDGAPWGWILAALAACAVAAGAVARTVRRRRGAGASAGASPAAAR